MDPRGKPTAVRFSEFGCKTVFIDNHRYPLAGLDPATHVFFGDIAAVGRRGWPGQARPRGDFGGEFGADGARTEHEKLNRTAVGLTRPSTWIPGTSPGMTLRGRRHV